MVSGSRSGVLTLGANCLLLSLSPCTSGGACCRGIWALGPGMVSLEGEERARLHRYRATRAVYQGTANRTGKAPGPTHALGAQPSGRRRGICRTGESALPAPAIAGCDVMPLGGSST